MAAIGRLPSFAAAVFGPSERLLSMKVVIGVRSILTTCQIGYRVFHFIIRPAVSSGKGGK